MDSLLIPKKVISYCFLLFILCDFKCYSQQNKLDSVIHKFTEYTQTAFQEKLFVHTDKEFYVAGEILWFKVYGTEASTHKPLNLSKVAYIDLINEEKKPVLQAKISLFQGSGHGSIVLPFTITSGSFKLRAYTNWMKNFSPEYFFEKNIPIVNTLANLSMEDTKKQPSYSVQFFPEGGNLVAGIESKVAFKISSQFDEGTEGKGFILNQNNDTVASFQTLKFGMGHFYFKPIAGHTYKAMVQTSDHGKITSSLPKVYDKGYVMAIEGMDANTISLKVQSNQTTVNQSTLVYLVAHTRQVIKQAEAQSLVKGKAVFSIDKNKLGEGISHFTIFDATGLPVCERLYFKRPLQKLFIEAKTSKKQYHTREKITLDIQARNSGGVPNMSMSVFRLDSLTGNTPLSMHSYLWLSSDLPGTIENPDYYFTMPSSETEQAIDNLMLTQGWRRFRWEDITENRISVFDYAPEHEGHIIPAGITDTRSGLPAANITAYLSIPGKRIQLYGAVSDQKGKLLFNTKDVYGQQEVVVQTNYTKDSTFQIALESPFSTLFSTKAFSRLLLNPYHKAILADKSVGMQIQRIYAEDKTNMFTNPQVDSTAFYHKSDKIYQLDNFTRFPTIEEVIREYVPEASVRRKQGKLHFQTVDRSNETFFTVDPLVLLDGLPVFDTDKLFAFDPLKIQKLDIVARRYFWGPLIVEGILSFTTYKHNLSGFQLDPNALIIEYEGLQRQREFYSPVYENETQLKSRLPDFRHVLFWSPVINTDAKGIKQVSFYSSDQMGKYIGIIQAITPEGSSACQTFTFEVTSDL